MNKYIEKNINTILNIFILIQPILDLITAVGLHISNSTLTLGIIVRTLFLLFFMYTCVFVYKKYHTLWYYFFIFLYFILYVLGIFLYKDKIGLFSEIQGFVKAFYFPILLISLYQIRDKLKISNMLLFTSLFIYLFLIFIPVLFKQGFQTYQIAKVGTLGYFNSANEISGIISILTPVMFIILHHKNNLILKSLFCIIYIFVILMIGTKTPILSLIITCFVAFYYLIKQNLKAGKYKFILFSSGIFLLLIMLLLLIIPKTNFYKNVKIHLNYLKLDNITEVFSDDKLVDHFIFSQRLTFMKNKSKLYHQANFYQQLLGIGYLKNKNHKAIKAIEMDYFDIYYSHGLIGFILYFGVYLYILRYLFKNQNKSSSTKMLRVSLFLILLLSLLTGHIITAPSVSIIVIVILLNLIKKEKKNLLFTSYNLEIGGIETSLINLLEKIDSTKYNVCLILEKKEGTLLATLDKQIEVKEFHVFNNKNIVIRKLANLLHRLIFMIFNYHNYDFSCCYATYSYSCNKLSLIASSNNSIYVHSNYAHLYNKQEYLQFFNSRNIDKFHHIIFVSNESKDDFLKVYPNLANKVKVFNNFINISKIKKLSSEKIKEKKEKNKKLFVFIGRLDDSSKKVSRIINLADNLEEIIVWIIGDGPDKEKYQKEVYQKHLEEKVIFIGQKANPYPYLLQADILILTSDYEGFPVVYLEAIAFNKNIITTIDVSDDYIKIHDYADIISSDSKKMVTEVKQILKRKLEPKLIDLESIQNKRIRALEKLFDEVI